MRGEWEEPDPSLGEGCSEPWGQAPRTVCVWDGALSTSLPADSTMWDYQPPESCVPVRNHRYLSDHLSPTCLSSSSSMGAVFGEAWLTHSMAGSPWRIHTLQVSQDGVPLLGSL